MIIRLSVALSVFALALSCGPSCEEVHEQVLNPTYQILDYLETNPSGAELAKNGCALILRKAEEIPDGVDKVREIADSRYSVTHRRCIRSYTSMDYGGRYFSHHGHHGHHGFYDPSPYESCALWQYDTTRDPNYGNVIELSQQMDLMYSQANHLCGEAAQGNLDGAQAEARDLAELIKTRIKPESMMIHRRLCGNEQQHPHPVYDERPQGGKPGAAAPASPATIPGGEN